MIKFFKGNTKVFVLEVKSDLNQADVEKLQWLFGNASSIQEVSITGPFVGPRKEMITPWSTNAVEITQNMGIEGILRIEEFFKADDFDAMLQSKYEVLDQSIFTIDMQPEPVAFIEDIAAYNQKEGLALSADEIDYLEGVCTALGRKLTDSEVFGFSQVNSEHCRHKIFNGAFIIDGKEKDASLFQLIKKTSKENPNLIVSAYKDNVAFVKGPVVEQFAPKRQDTADFFKTDDFESVISLKAETHNFPTTVEPFNGAATGSGGEIRDRLAGGKGSLPLAGTAVYMTSYSRSENDRSWEQATEARDWLYQSPIDILIKASDGASDFGNKFGQPMICGSVLTFEHFEKGKKYGFDKVIMQAGGIGYGKLRDSLKDEPEVQDKVVILGGDNYRIGMGGGAVSSVATGEFNNAIELNAIQRSNPEMQKRAMNAIRAMAESQENPIVSIHDHGAGGHLNCLSELLEDIGGAIDVQKLPVGDPTLSDKEIIGNESQERMGLVMKPADIDNLKNVAERERAPMYVVGEATGDMEFKFVNQKTGQNPMDWKLANMFGSSPKTILEDKSSTSNFEAISYQNDNIKDYIEQVLQLEAVACKDWLTNKVDRSVTGKVATQQTCGTVQLPLNNVAVMALDHKNNKGVATSIGHAPVAALVDPIAGSKLAIAEALTNLVWAPLSHGTKGISLSANWMWPAKNEGENHRLYQAVQSISDFACDLGINIPTGKDSLSMTQKYPNGSTVYSPGTVIISSVGEVSDIRKTISPAIIESKDSTLVFIDFSKDKRHLGGSSFAQVVNKLGKNAPTIQDNSYFKSAFNAVQALIKNNLVLSGHDIGSGGLITSLLEMHFTNNQTGANINLEKLQGDLVEKLFSENPGVVLQVASIDNIQNILKEHGVDGIEIGQVNQNRAFSLSNGSSAIELDLNNLRDLWFRTSYLLDKKQSGAELAKDRFDNYKKQTLQYNFPSDFTGKFEQYKIDQNRKSSSGIKAAIIREKGVNGDREMAYAMFLAGMDVKDVHMTDLISGREDLSGVNMVVFVGGFSNSDVLGSAKGWAGAFLYNPKAKLALDNFYARQDTLSLGVCNGCQLMVELGLLYPNSTTKPALQHNASGKFESSFLNVTIPENNSVMLGSLTGSTMGIWVAHGEGKFELNAASSEHNVVMQYADTAYPANPNGSDEAIAGMCSADGRHLVMMPHLERATFPWNWAHYDQELKQHHEVTPWIEAFVNAKDWIKSKQ